MNIDNNLSETFGIERIQNGQVIDRAGEVVPPRDDALDHDYHTTRDNLHNLLEQGKDALVAAISIAKQSEHPRAFEVVGGLMKNIADINHQLLDLHKKKHALTGTPAEETKANSVTNNAIFVGSTAELSKMLNDLRKDK